MIIIFGFWALSLLIYGLIEIGGIIGGIGVGFLLGVTYLWMWLVGDIFDTEEYDQGTVPEWMTFLANNPKGDPSFPFYCSSKAWRITSVCFVAAISIAFMVTGFMQDSALMLSLSISILVVWIVGVYIIERYFERNYTRTKRS